MEASSVEVMSKLDKVIVTSTLGGETLSLAAAKAALSTYHSKDVIGHIWKQGEKMWGGLNELFSRYGIRAQMKGFWPCPQIAFENDKDLERFFRTAYRNGVSLYNISYVNFSHQDKDIDEALARLEKACGEI